jgi:hypothetical protein
MGNYGVISGGATHLRLVNGTTQLALASIADNEGIAIAGNQFTVDGVGNYLASIKVYPNAIGQGMNCIIQIWNATLAALAGSAPLSVPLNTSGNVGLGVNVPFNVANTAHQFQIRIVVPSEVRFPNACDLGVQGGTVMQAIISSVATENSAGIFGSGADGDVTLAAGTLTINRDMYYRNLTLNTGGNINTAGFRLFVQNLLDVEGVSIISNVGGAGGAAGGAGGAAGAAAPGQTLGGGFAGAAGAGGFGAGVAGTNATTSGGGAGGASGAGAGGAGAAGGTMTAPTAAQGGPTAANVARAMPNSVTLALAGTNVATLIQGGAGGASGGGDGAAVIGGGGGGGGGVVMCAANRIAVGVALIFAAVGGAGGDGSGAVNAGGGGGGGGGFVATVSGGPLPAGTQVLCTGGAGGAAGGGGGAAGAAGADGTSVHVQVGI